MANRVRNTTQQEIPSPTPCGVVPTRFVSPSELAEEWDRIVLTEYESIVTTALRLINQDFQGLAFVSKDDFYINRTRKDTRIAKVRLGSLEKPVPLNSMGDGMMRILQLILKVFSARGGFLLIDEFENGLHYSIQSQVWRLIFDLAVSLDIQVFATTHSWDCIKSFSEVAIEFKEVDGILFRVGSSIRKSDEGQVIATMFDEVSLANISQAEMDVR
jgi:AAA15 family ATPase/GTPase